MKVLAKEIVNHSPRYLDFPAAEWALWREKHGLTHEEADQLLRTSVFRSVERGDYAPPNITTLVMPVVGEWLEKQGGIEVLREKSRVVETGRLFRLLTERKDNEK